MPLLKPRRKRPGVLVRFYPTDLENLNRFCADSCTPRENFIRRLVLTSLRERNEAQAKVTAALNARKDHDIHTRKPRRKARTK